MEAIKERPEHTLQKDQLDKIYSDAKEIVDAWQHKFIHTDTLWELLFKNRIPTKRKKGAVKAMAVNWNKMLDKLYEVSLRHCKAENTDYKPPMTVFKQYIDILKANIK